MMTQPSKNSKSSSYPCGVRSIASKRSSPVFAATATNGLRTTSDLGLFEGADDNRARDAVGEEVKS